MLIVQASTDPEYQALLAKQAGLDAPTATQIAAGLLSQQQKEAGLASVFKRDDENLARRYGAVSDHLTPSLQAVQDFAKDLHQASELLRLLAADTALL